MQFAFREANDHPHHCVAMYISLIDKILKLVLHVHRGIRRGKVEAVTKVATLSSKI